MTITPLPEDVSIPPSKRQKSLKNPTTCKHLSSIEEKDMDMRVEYISSGSASPGDSLSTNFDQSFKPEICSTPFGQPPQREVIFDPFGLPLSPQPLSDGHDPLSWSQRKKIIILLQVSVFSFLAQFLAMCISSILWPLHKVFGVNMNQVSYTIGSYIVFVGVGPFLWNPLAHAFGRRPLYIMSLVGLLVTSIFSGFSHSYPMIMAFRSLGGLFAAVPIGLGSVVVCDLFYQHERGFFMGIYMVFQIMGGHLGPMIGGYIHSGINWHWCFYIPAIMAAILLVSFSLTVPETLYFRYIESLQRPHMNLYQQELIRKRRSDGQKLSLRLFGRPFKMLRYPSIVLPSIYYSVTSGYANIVFIISSSMLFHYYYGFHSWQTGILMGTPLTLGSWLGEFGAGGFSDWVTERRALKRGGKRIPEDRLYAMLPGVFLAPLGLLIEGMTLHHRTHWIGAGLGIGIASAGFQIITTVTYAYTADCYPRQTSETATVLNFGRQIFSFSISFYTFSFLLRYGVQTAWTIYAVVEIACFLPMIVLMWKGASWRDSFGGPDWNLDLY